MYSSIEHYDRRGYVTLHLLRAGTNQRAFGVSPFILPSVVDMGNMEGFQRSAEVEGSVGVTQRFASLVPKSKDNGWRVGVLGDRNDQGHLDQSSTSETNSCLCVSSRVQVEIDAALE